MRNISKNTFVATVVAGALIALAFVGFAFWRAASALRQVSLNLATENEIQLRSSRSTKMFQANLNGSIRPQCSHKSSPFTDTCLSPAPPDSWNTIPQETSLMSMRWGESSLRPP